MKKEPIRTIFVSDDRKFLRAIRRIRRKAQRTALAYPLRTPSGRRRTR